MFTRRQAITSPALGQLSSCIKMLLHHLFIHSNYLCDEGEAGAGGFGGWYPIAQMNRLRLREGE